ncbi:hypothetical protein DFJ77DRAFT_117091 [Powellomyces hirtus]|nr:hypothetical protein DFJ77DRAFT_117091 [Powellomyces hirtus]
MPPVAETECVVPLESNTNAPSVNAIVEDDAVTVRRGTRSRSRSHSQPPQQQQQQAQPQPEAEPERYMTVAERRNANVARSNKRRAEEARKAAQSLAFVDLSDYDDVLCDLLLDSVYLGFRTHKMNDAFYKSPADALKNAKPFDPSAPVSWKNRQHILATDRSLMNSDVIAAVIVDLVREYVLDKKDMDQATAAFMRCIEKPGSIKSDNYPGASLKRSFQALKPFFRNRTAEQIAAFKEHAKRYIAMYHPNAGYEITSTSRYKSSGKTEACIKATQDFQPGDEIRHCVGVIAGLSEDDEDYLHNRDFSVMFSTKKDCNCLFLGPARFVNHDCDPNCKFFVTDRSNQICFKVVKEIHVGEELTTFYGKDYFGVGNAECLCATCERRGVSRPKTTSPRSSVITMWRSLLWPGSGRTRPGPRPGITIKISFLARRLGTRSPPPWSLCPPPLPSDAVYAKRSWMKSPFRASALDAFATCESLAFHGRSANARGTGPQTTPARSK